ncbi:MAG: hypothetical protein JWO11_1193 [Nocardioides sp.]|nr:hypothetical protein [Nocardioides sp.]
MKLARTAFAAAALFLAAPVLAGCGTESGDVATDPGPGSSAPGNPMPTDVPAAKGPVRTLNLATVMDTGSPELCVGPVAESYPPQCGGPPITNWAWDDQQKMFEQQGDVRWGTFAVTGTFDGTSVTVTEAIAGALYDAAMPTPTPTPSPGTTYSRGELETMAEGLGRDLPGAQGAYAADGHVLVDVLYDDGSLRAWADEEYGTNVVIVTSMLVDVG